MPHQMDAGDPVHFTQRLDGFDADLYSFTLRIHRLLKTADDLLWNTHTGDIAIKPAGCPH